MKTSEKIAFYPGTFDPFTLGTRVGNATSACTSSTKSSSAIGINDAKRCLFSPEQRVEMLQKLFAEEPRVEIITYDNLNRRRSPKARGHGHLARNTLHRRL